MKATNVTRPGENHTGITLHPDMIKEMIEGTVEFGPTSSGGPDLIAQDRIRMAKLGGPMATMPPLRNVAVERLVLLDKLGGRLAFERMGVRLYDALVSKYDAYGSFKGGPSRDDLVRIRGDEHRHMQLAEEIVVSLDGDPTVVTPTANLQSLASRGVLAVLVDPRSNLVECLEAMMIAELADHESWAVLGIVANVAGEKQLEPRLRDAERLEEEHITRVRSWLIAANQTD